MRVVTRVASVTVTATVLALALAACGPADTQLGEDQPGPAESAQDSAGESAAEQSAGTESAGAGRMSAILVSPIHDAQVVRGDDGMDHVEYELLVVSVLAEPVTLSSVAVLDPAGTELMRIHGDVLAAGTQTLFAKTPQPAIPASGAVSVDVDLILPPDTAPDRVTHRISYQLAADTQSAVMFDVLDVEGPEVAIDRRPAIVIKPPLQGENWLVTTACCKPNVHRDLRIAVDGRRIATAETFAVDWAKVENNRLYDGDGTANEQHYAFGADVLAVADGTVVSIQDGKPETTPYTSMTPETKSDYGGNHVMLEIAPNVIAFYAHLQPGSLTVEVGDVVQVGTALAKLGNTGPSQGPHLHFGLLDVPDPFIGKSLPFVLDRFTLVGAVDFDVSEADRLVIEPDSKQVSAAYPLYGGIQHFS